MATQVDAGSHVIRIQYNKDASADQGLDTAWADNVRIYSNDHLIEQHLFSDAVDDLATSFENEGKLTLVAGSSVLTDQSHSSCESAGNLPMLTVSLAPAIICSCASSEACAEVDHEFAGVVVSLPGDRGNCMRRKHNFIDIEWGSSCRLLAHVGSF
jgi:hypothetical protein